MLMLLPSAFAHGTTFGAVDISVANEDPNEVWVLTEGWGLAVSMDAGESWAWICEEALGAEEIYDVIAVSPPGHAIIATRDGLRLVDTECASSAQAGTEGVFFPAVGEFAGGWLGIGIAEEYGGVWFCDLAGCEETELMAPGMFPKSVWSDGRTAWVTVVYVDTLKSELWRSEDRQTWTLAHTWPDGDTDPRVLYADDERVLVWRRTREEADTPELLVSDDGGVTFTSTFSTGWYTDDAPALLPVEGALLLGSIQGARTWRSEDEGATWSEVSADVPAVRCADRFQDEQSWSCGDHLQDGVDLFRTTDGRTWHPAACLEDALPAACASDACDPLLSAYQLAGSYGGGECDTIITPPAAAAPPGPCGCGEGGAAFLVAAAALGRRRAHRPRNR